MLIMRNIPFSTDSSKKWKIPSLPLTKCHKFYCSMAKTSNLKMVVGSVTAFEDIVAESKLKANTTGMFDIPSLNSMLEL